MSEPIPIDKGANLPTGDVFVEMGVTGLKEHGGVIDEEFLNELKGDRGPTVWAQMGEIDATVGAILFAVEMLLRKVSWRVEPGGDQPLDIAKADFLDSCRDDMLESWTDTIASFLSFLQFGYSVHEPVYKRRAGPTADPRTTSDFADGRIGWRKMPIRSQDTIRRWIFFDSGEVKGLEQQAPPDYRIRIIPCERFLLFRTTTKKENPEGRSILHNAYRAWWFKKNLEEIEAIGVERDLAGLPVMKVPASMLSDSATAEEKALLSEFQRLIRNIKRDEKEGAIVPMQKDEKGNDLYALELLTTGGRRQHDTSAIIQRYATQIAQTILADFIMLGHEKVGSFALASSKTNLFAVALGAWLDSIAGILNRNAVPRLFNLNTFGQTEALPKLAHTDIETVDLGELGDYISKLAASGASLFPDRELENVLRGHANLPELTEELEGGPAPTPPPVAPAPGTEDGTQGGPGATGPGSASDS